jgi:uncharacterized membrane protein YcaP (DUF421 family)
MDKASHYVELLLGLSAKPDDITFGQIALRAILVYSALIAFVRMGKKRSLGQATPFDAVLIILIGSIASRAVSGTTPFFTTLFAVAMLIFLHFLMSYLSCLSMSFGSLIKGHPTVLIRDGRVNRQALRAAHMSDDDLEEDLRKEGVGSPTEVGEARLERDGKLSVLRK